MPHPVYGWIYWLCVLNPSQSTFDGILPLLDKYYQATQKRFLQRVKAGK